MKQSSSIDSGGFRTLTSFMEGVFVVASGPIFLALFLVYNMNTDLWPTVPGSFDQFMNGFAVIIFIVLGLEITAIVPQYKRFLRSELPAGVWCIGGAALLFLVPARAYFAGAGTNAFDTAGWALMIAGLGVAGYGFYQLWRRKSYRLCLLLGLGGLLLLVLVQGGAGFGTLDQAIFAFSNIFIFAGLGIFLFDRAVAVQLSSQSTKLDEQLQTARSKSASGDYDAALQIIETARRQAPFSEVIWNNRGNILFHLNRYQPAITSYRRALELNPDYLNAWNNLGVAYRQLENYPAALKCHDRALALAPNHPIATRNRELVLLQKEGKSVPEHPFESTARVTDHAATAAGTDAETALSSPVKAEPSAVPLSEPMASKTIERETEAKREPVGEPAPEPKPVPSSVAPEPEPASTMPTIECPACGTGVAEDSDSCPECGFMFIDDFDGETIECFSCGAMISIIAEQCPKCGVIFDDMLADGFEPLAADEMVGALADEPLEFECPECGATVGAHDPRCPGCGVLFEEEEPMLGANEGAFECPECGATVAATDDRCPGCGVYFEPEEPALAGFACPECGAAVSETDLRCPGCGVQFEPEAPEEFECPE